MSAPLASEAAPAGTTVRRFLTAWLGWVTIGEGAGFLAPALSQQLTSLGPEGSAFPFLAAAGLVEGAVLGWSQAHVLQRLLPALSVRRWVLLTSAAAAAAWLIGLAPGELSGTWMVWPPAAQIGAGILAGAALLASIGSAQWMELRRHLRRAWRWVLATGAAWAAGLLVFLAVATPLWEPGQEPALSVLIGMLAAFAMAAIMALVTGVAMARMVFEGALGGGVSRTQSHGEVPRD